MKRLDIWEPSKLAAQCIIARLDLDLLIENDNYFCRNIRGENPFKAVIKYIDEHESSCEMELFQ